MTITFNVTEINGNKYTVTKDIQSSDELLSHILIPDGGNYLLLDYYLSSERVVAGYLPYIIRANAIVWNVSKDEVTIQEFLDTHPRCTKDGINVELGTPMAGGPGWILADAAIDIFIVVLSTCNPKLGLSLTVTKSMIQAVNEFRNYYTEREITPKEQFDAMLCTNEHVSRATIMDLFNYDEYHADQFLKDFGFYKDKETGVYKISEINRNKIMQLINKLDDRSVE